MFVFIIYYEFTYTTTIGIITIPWLRPVREEWKCLSHGLVLVQENSCS